MVEQVQDTLIALGARRVKLMGRAGEPAEERRGPHGILIHEKLAAQRIREGGYGYSTQPLAACSQGSDLLVAQAARIARKARRIVRQGQITS